MLASPKKFLNADTVPESIRLEGCDIKIANTGRNLGVSLDPVLSFQKQTSCYLSSIWIFAGSVQYATIPLRMLQNKNLFVCSFMIKLL